MIRYLAGWMQQMSYPKRFLLIGCFFFLALSYLTYGLYRTNQDSVDFSVKERVGVHYLQGLSHVVSLVEAHRYQALGESLGLGGSSAELSGQMDKAWQTVSATHSELGADALDVGSGLGSAGSALKALGGKASPAQTLQAHTQVAGQLGTLIADLCDKSNLTLDPDIDSYYLMDTLCFRMPVLQSFAGEAQALALQAGKAGQVAPEHRTRAVELQVLLQEQLGALQGDLAKSQGANEVVKQALAGVVAGLGQSMQQAGQVLSQLVDSKVAVPAAGWSSGKDREISDAYLTQGLNQLDELLVARIDRYSSQRNTYVGTAVIALLLAGLLFYLLYLSITAQLGGEPFYVQDVIRQIARGNLDTSVNVRGGDHHSVLADIGMMRNQLRDTVAQMRTMALEVQRAADELSGSAQQVSQSSSRQSEAAASMAAAVEELSTSLSVSASRSGEARGLSDEAAERTSAGGKVIEAAVDGMGKIERDVTTVADIISRLSQQSAAIVNIVDVIRDVADQTNLLALNAAIEAARAGEAGRGFAVVADEVRKLAERTAGSTTEITNIVSQIQETARAVSSTMQVGMNTIAEGQQHANEAGGVIHNIRDRIATLVDTVNDIAATLQQQSSTSQLLAANVEQVAQMSEENSRSVKESATTATGLQRLAGELSALAMRFKV